MSTLRSATAVIASASGTFAALRPRSATPCDPRPALFLSAAEASSRALTLRIKIQRARLARPACRRPGTPLLEGLEAFYARAIRDYLSSDDGPGGCLVICTAVTDAAGNSEIKSALAAILADVNSVVVARIARTQAEGIVARAAMRRSWRGWRPARCTAWPCEPGPALAEAI